MMRNDGSLGIRSLVSVILFLFAGTAWAESTIPVTDANIQHGLSPYNWIRKPDSLSSPVNAASLAVGFKGTRKVVLRVDTARHPLPKTERYPILAWTINGGALQTHQLKPQETTVVLAEGVADPAIDLYLRGLSPWEDRWTGEIPFNAVTITGFLVDAGAVTTASALPGKVWWNIGDSIMAGDGAAYAKGQGRPKNDLWAASDESRASYGFLLARHYGCRESRLAFGGYNWGGGLAKVPALDALIDWQSATVSRLNGECLDPSPDVVLVNLGTNGRPKEQQVTAALEKLRRRAGRDARIIVMIPFTGAGRAEITAAFNAYKRAAGDEKAWLVDLGRIQFDTADGIHPTAGGHRAIFEAALPALDPIVR